LEGSVSSPEELLSRVVVETVKKRSAEELAREHNVLRAQAVREYANATGYSKVRIAREIADALVAEGIAPERVKGLGVSHDSIRNILER
jgi:hypothetical protein